MKLEEAIAKAKILNDSLKELTDEYEGQGSFIAAGMAVTFKLVLDTILSALRPVSRELVEQVWGGMWIYDPDTGYAYCEMCKHTICQTDYLNGKLPPFCEMCGAPMTDEAVQMVMERLEALKDD